MAPDLNVARRIPSSICRSFVIRQVGMKSDGEKIRRFCTMFKLILAAVSKGHVFIHVIAADMMLATGVLRRVAPTLVRQPSIAFSVSVCLSVCVSTCGGVNATSPRLRSRIFQ